MPRRKTRRRGGSAKPQTPENFISDLEQLVSRGIRPSENVEIQLHRQAAEISLNAPPAIRSRIAELMEQLNNLQQVAGRRRRKTRRRA